MDNEKIRNTIVKELHNFTKRPVVMMKQAKDRPRNQKGDTDYPFIAYNFLSTFINDRQVGIYEQTEVSSVNPRFEKDLIDTVYFQPQFTISFTAYAKTSLEAKNLIQIVWGFFKHNSYYPLLKSNIVVVEVGNIQNRDVLEVETYERREGLDVRFRTTHKVQQRLETIETYELNKKYI